MNSLHLRWHPVKGINAVIQGSASTHHHAAPSTKGSNAQETDLGSEISRTRFALLTECFDEFVPVIQADENRIIT